MYIYWNMVFCRFTFLIVLCFLFCVFFVIYVNFCCDTFPHGENKGTLSLYQSIYPSICDLSTLSSVRWNTWLSHMIHTYRFPQPLRGKQTAIEMCTWSRDELRHCSPCPLWNIDIPQCFSSQSLSCSCPGEWQSGWSGENHLPLVNGSYSFYLSENTSLKYRNKWWLPVASDDI